MRLQVFILCSLIAALTVVQCSVLNRLNRVNERLSELELSLWDVLGG